MKELIFPLSERKILLDLRAGEEVSVSGVLYTARDAAHKRIVAAMEAGEPLPETADRPSLLVRRIVGEQPLWDIAKAAGTSTGSIYTRFTDKAGLFRALVEPAAGELKRRFLEIQESFHRFDGQTQQEEMGRYTAHAQEGLFDYIYEHLPEFELLLRRAAGTEYAHYIDELVEIEVSYTYKYMEVIGCESVRSGQVTEDLIHIVTTAYFNGMFEPVRHRMDKARALHYIRQLNRYHMAGFETIFHPENFR